MMMMMMMMMIMTDHFTIRFLTWNGHLPTIQT